MLGMCIELLLSGLLTAFYSLLGVSKKLAESKSGLRNDILSTPFWEFLLAITMCLSSKHTCYFLLPFGSFSPKPCSP